MKFIKTIVSVLFCSLLIAVSGAFFLVFADADEEFAPDEVVIKLRSVRNLRQIAKKYRLSPAPIEQFGTRPIYRMRILDGADPLQRAAELQNDVFLRVEFAEPNFLTQAPEARGSSWSIGGTSTQYANQWFREPLRIPQAHQQTQGLGVKIAVLDTGIDLNHPAFAGRLIAGYDFVNDDNNPSEEGVFGTNPGFGHGTHVAGLASLVAPQAQIMPVRVLDANGVGNIWVLAEALRFAADPDGNPATPDGADVINLSLATRRETNLLAEIIGEITCGEDDDFGGGYGTWSGTSMSTPLVAGTAALVRAQNPDWTAFQIEERIIVSSITMTSPNPPQRRIDVAGSVGQ